MIVETNSLKHNMIVMIAWALAFLSALICLYYEKKWLWVFVALGDLYMLTKAIERHLIIKHVIKEIKKLGNNDKL